jgi:hypothetical protein
MATDERGAALVRHLLGGGRLVTLIGPAGNGKSHLARVVATRWARRHPGAVHLMELETLVDGIALHEEAAAVFAMPPPAGHSVLRALADQIGGARTLLVLDGCDGVADSCARIVSSDAETAVIPVVEGRNMEAAQAFMKELRLDPAATVLDEEPSLSRALNITVKPAAVVLHGSNPRSRARPRSRS